MSCVGCFVCFCFCVGCVSGFGVSFLVFCYRDKEEDHVPVLHQFTLRPPRPLLELINSSHMQHARNMLNDLTKAIRRWTEKMGIYIWIVILCWGLQTDLVVCACFNPLYLISVQPPSRSFCTTPKNREPLQLLLCVMHFHVSNICKLKQRKLNCEQ